jgi:hypothetical protein
MGQSSKDFPLQEERLVFTVTGTRNKDYIAPTTDRIQRHFADSFGHKTLTNGFSKAMDQTRPSFRHLADQYKGISAGKKMDVFCSPKIRKYFRDKRFERILCSNVKRAWNDCRLVAAKLLGIQKSLNVPVNC